MKKTEEVLPQYDFAKGNRKNDMLYRTSPAPFGGTLPKGEGRGFSKNCNFQIYSPLYCPRGRVSIRLTLAFAYGIKTQKEGFP